MPERSKDWIRQAERDLESAKAVYIPARYPNGWAEGIPAEYITEEDVKNAISHSEKILQLCKGLLAKKRFINKKN